MGKCGHEHVVISTIEGLIDGSLQARHTLGTMPRHREGNPESLLVPLVIYLSGIGKYIYLRSPSRFEYFS